MAILTKLRQLGRQRPGMTKLMTQAMTSTIQDGSQVQDTSHKLSGRARKNLVVVNMRVISHAATSQLATGQWKVSSKRTFFHQLVSNEISANTRTINWFRLKLESFTD